MHECLLCKRDMKTAKTIFGNGCIKSIFSILDIKVPKKTKNKESYLYKIIMKELNIKNLTEKQKVWLTDRYLTLKYLKKLKYGDYTKLKEELKEDISNISKIVTFSGLKTAETVALKQAYTLFKKEEKFEKYINEITYMKDTAEVGAKLAIENLPINLIIKRNTNPFEISAIKNMQYVLWQVVALGGNVVGFDTSAELLEHSLTNDAKELVITEGKIVDEIKKDSQFQQKLREIVDEYGKNTSKFNTEDAKKMGLQFNNSDLYFAIHKANLKVVGEKQGEKWNLEIELIDTYDYTDWKDFDDYISDANSVPKSMFSSFIYNLAHISTLFGVIKEYRVVIRFNINNYEVV